MTKSEFKNFYRELRNDEARNVGYKNVRDRYDSELIRQCIKNRSPKFVAGYPLHKLIKGLKAGGAFINKESRTFKVFGKTSNIFNY